MAFIFHRFLALLCEMSELGFRNDVLHQPDATRTIVTVSDELSDGSQANR